MKQVYNFDTGEYNEDYLKVIKKVMNEISNKLCIKCILHSNCSKKCNQYINSVQNESEGPLGHPILIESPLDHMNPNFYTVYHYSSRYPNPIFLSEPLKID